MAPRRNQGLLVVSEHLPFTSSTPHRNSYEAGGNSCVEAPRCSPRDPPLLTLSWLYVHKWWKLAQRQRPRHAGYINPCAFTRCSEAAPCTKEARRLHLVPAERSEGGSRWWRRPSAKLRTRGSLDGSAGNNECARVWIKRTWTAPTHLGAQFNFHMRQRMHSHNRARWLDRAIRVPRLCTARGCATALSSDQEKDCRTAAKRQREGTRLHPSTSVSPSLTPASRQKSHLHSCDWKTTSLRTLI